MGSTNEVNAVAIETVATMTDAAKLDDLLWRVLWEPLSLPRDVRHVFPVDGEAIELVATVKGRVVGGLVALLTSDTEVELRHIAVASDAQHCGNGRRLIAELVRFVVPRGCRRIHVIARNTSAHFFGQLGFRTAPGETPDHPVFRKQGITFELLERTIGPTGAGDA